MRPEYRVRTDPGAMPYVSASSQRQPGAYIGSKSILFRSATRCPGDDAIEPGAARIDFVGREAGIIHARQRYRPASSERSWFRRSPQQGRKDSREDINESLSS